MTYLVPLTSTLIDQMLFLIRSKTGYNGHGDPEFSKGGGGGGWGGDQILELV